MWGQGLGYPRSASADKDYRVGRTEATMLKLRDLGIDPPEQVLYHPYARSWVRSDNARVGEGSKKVEWIFDISHVHSLATLMEQFFDAVTDSFADDRYIRTDIRTGDYAEPAQSFTNYKVTVWRPEFMGPDGVWVAQASHAVQAVRFTFTNLETP